MRLGDGTPDWVKEYLESCESIIWAVSLRVSLNEIGICVWLDRVGKPGFGVGCNHDLVGSLERRNAEDKTVSLGS